MMRTVLVANLALGIGAAFAQELAPQPIPPAPERCATCTAAVLRNAQSQLGARYVRGGADPSRGFDCAGLVQYVYQTSCGNSLPRSSHDQFNVGERVAKHDLRPGDLVFFRFPKIGWHVGIYLGRNMFIHSPNHRRVVSVNSLLARAYTVTYMGARRVLPVAVASGRRCPPEENLAALDLADTR